MHRNFICRLRHRTSQFQQRFQRNRDGVAAVEFAFLVPVMFMLLIGSVEISQALTVDRRVTQVASASADLIARQKSITTEEVEGIMDIIDQLVRPYDPSLLRVTVLNVIAAINDAKKTTVCWTYEHNGGAASYSPGQSYDIPDGLAEAGNSVIVAEVIYNYQPIIFEYFINAGFPLREKFYLKPRKSSYIEYNGNKCL